jgi:Fe-S cluster assembly iron-binding protein IscA
MLKITKEALTSIQNSKSENNIPVEYALRVTVYKGLDGVLNSNLCFDLPSEQDTVLDVEGTKIVYSRNSLPYLENSVLCLNENNLSLRFISDCAPSACASCSAGCNQGK